MKIIKFINTGTFILAAIIVVLIFVTDLENILYVFPILYLVSFISRRIIINRILNDNATIIKIKSKRIYEYVAYTLSVIFGILLIYNFWGQLAFRHDAANLLFAFMGGILLIESTQGFFYKQLFMTKDLISLNNGKGLSEWSKINEFEIKDKKLIIRTPNQSFWIRFNDIDSSDTEKIISILNQKLSNLFNGTLVYDNEIKIIGNKA